MQTTGFSICTLPTFSEICEHEQSGPGNVLFVRQISQQKISNDHKTALLGKTNLGHERSVMEAQRNLPMNALRKFQFGRSGLQRFKQTTTMPQPFSRNILPAALCHVAKDFYKTKHSKFKEALTPSAKSRVRLNFVEPKVAEPSMSHIRSTPAFLHSATCSWENVVQRGTCGTQSLRKVGNCHLRNCTHHKTWIQHW